MVGVEDPEVEASELGGVEGGGDDGVGAGVDHIPANHLLLVPVQPAVRHPGLEGILSDEGARRALEDEEPYWQLLQAHLLPLVVDLVQGHQQHHGGVPLHNQLELGVVEE